MNYDTLYPSLESRHQNVIWSTSCHQFLPTWSSVNFMNVIIKKWITYVLISNSAMSYWCYFTVVITKGHLFVENWFSYMMFFLVLVFHIVTRENKEKLLNVVWGKITLWSLPTHSFNSKISIEWTSWVVTYA